MVLGHPSIQITTLSLIFQSHFGNLTENELYELLPTLNNSSESALIDTQSHTKV